LRTELLSRLVQAPTAHAAPDHAGARSEDTDGHACEKSASLLVPDPPFEGRCCVLAALPQVISG
jgi:hypothetical protein